MKTPKVPELEKALREELLALSNQQWAALQKAIFLSFTRVQGKEYDVRATRIAEICKLLDACKVVP